MAKSAKSSVNINLTYVVKLAKVTGGGVYSPPPQLNKCFRNNF